MSVTLTQVHDVVPAYCTVVYHNVQIRGRQSCQRGTVNLVHQHQSSLTPCPESNSIPLLGGLQERQKVKMFSFGFVWEHVYDEDAHTRDITCEGNYCMHDRLMNYISTRVHFSQCQAPSTTQGDQKMGPLFMCMCTVLQALQHHSLCISV